VRATYAHLPCQAFWTWVTGKALSDPDSSQLLVGKAPSLPRICGQLAWSWSLIAASVALAIWTQSAFVSVAAMVITMNRVRGLQHTYHYTIHGSTVENKSLARWMCEYLMGIPTLHVSWNEYIKVHLNAHHGQQTFCTAADPDQQFMSRHGFHRGMSHSEFWLRICLSPFHPLRIIEHVVFRFQQNFVVPEWPQKIPRVAFWAVVLASTTYFGVLKLLAIYYFIPALLILQLSSYVQHITEHLWFPPDREGLDRSVYYASLTWGRFLGRPHPSLGRAARSPFMNSMQHLSWWLMVLIVDLPLRVFSFMQDLSSHDFHHRNVQVSFWAIAESRAICESRESRWGPMTETWSVLESVLVLRDHLVYDRSDPFGLLDFEKTSRLNLSDSIGC
jgi:hypothetical protein